MAGLVVDVMIGRHHGAGIGLLHRHFKRQQKHIVQFSETKVDGRVIAGPLAEGMPGIMFQRRKKIAGFPLQASYVASGKNCRQIGILPQGFFGAAPADIAGNIQDRSESLVAANLFRFLPNLPADLLDQLRVPRRAVIQPRREKRGSLDHQADETLFMGHRRDPQPRFLDEKFL